MKRCFLFLTLSSIVLMFMSGLLSAQDPNEAYREFLRNRNAEMENWRTKANAEFSAYLNEAWSEFQIKRGKESPLQPVDEQPTYYPGTSPLPAKRPGAGLPAWPGALMGPVHPERISLVEEPGCGFDVAFERK